MSMIPYSYNQPITSNNTFSFGQPISQVQNSELGNGSTGNTQSLNLNYDIPLNIGSGTQELPAGQYGQSSAQASTYSPASSQETSSPTLVPQPSWPSTSGYGYPSQPETPWSYPPESSMPWSSQQQSPYGYSSPYGTGNTPLNIVLNVPTESPQCAQQSSNNSDSSMMSMLLLVLLLKFRNNNN